MRPFTKVIILMGILLMVGCGPGDSGSDSASPTIPNFAGEWTMIANTNYTFDLTLTQSGGTISGLMDSTNSSDPTDPVTGTVTLEGNVTFTRERAGAWTQVYTGTVTPKGDLMVMEGTFTQGGVTGNFPWRAEKSLLPAPTGQLLKQTVSIAKAATYETNVLTAPGNGTLTAHVKSLVGSDLVVSFFRVSDSTTFNKKTGPDVNISTFCNIGCTIGQTWKVVIYNPSGVAIDASITVTFNP
jgi:hypothetical protein